MSPLRCRRRPRRRPERLPAGGGDHVLNDSADAGFLDEGLDAAAGALAAAGFAALWQGRAADPADLLARPDGVAAGALAALVHRGRAEVDAAGRLVGIHGLTLRPTRHRFVAAGRARHTWCAFDSIGIPAALGVDAVAVTDCPACGETLTFHLVEGGLRGGGDAVLWLPAAPEAHLLTEFCARADLYCSLEHLERRIAAAEAPGEVVDPAAAAALGRDAWADVAAVVLASG